jgi:hypothetical protein
MQHRIHVVHWRPDEAGPLLETVRKAGFAVTYCETPDGSAVTNAIREKPPDAVVIDLSRLPSHGKEIAIWLRNRKETRHVPLVFSGGDPAKVEKIRELLPDAVFAESSRLASSLKAVLKAPVGISNPVVPPPMMQRYGNRTAAQKMGVRAGTKVGVMDPPRDYLTVLGEIPADTEIIEDSDAVQDVTIWFIHEPEAFLAALPRMRNIAARTRLWVLWRKGSRNGITQNFVRETAIDAGLVDYKICSVDGHWSGIAFARSKK